MEREYVESSMIESMGYDSQQSILEIEFRSNGQVWQYYDVPENVWCEMQYTDSKGKFFHANISGQYTESRIQ